MISRRENLSVGGYGPLLGRRTRGVALVDAMLALMIVTFASLLVCEVTVAMNKVNTFDAAAREARDRLDTEVLLWRQGVTPVEKTGVLPSGADFRFTPSVTTINGLVQLRAEIIWNSMGSLPVSNAGWRYRVGVLVIKSP